MRALPKLACAPTFTSSPSLHSQCRSRRRYKGAHLAPALQPALCKSVRVDRGQRHQLVAHESHSPWARAHCMSRVAESQADRPGGSRPGSSGPRPHLASTMCRKWQGGGGESHLTTHWIPSQLSTHQMWLLLGTRTPPFNPTCPHSHPGLWERSVRLRPGQPRSLDALTWAEGKEKMLFHTVFKQKCLFFSFICTISWGFRATDHTCTRPDPRSPLWCSSELGRAGEGSFHPLRNQVHEILHQGTQGTLQRTEISYYIIVPWQKTA